MDYRLLTYGFHFVSRLWFGDLGREGWLNRRHDAASFQILALRGVLLDDSPWLCQDNVVSGAV